MKNFKLGQKAKCKVTGFTGTLTSRIEYLNGCVQYCIKPSIDKDGKMPEGEYIDIVQIEILPDDKVDVEPTGLYCTGGPQMDCPRG